MSALQILLGLLAVASAGFAAYCVRAILRFLQRGPSMAVEAYQRGESLPNWWEASSVSNMGENPRDVERFDLSGRRDDAVGDEFVEERAAYAR